MNSELVKKAVDDFGRLSFVLETYVKLAQTGDHSEIAGQLLRAAIKDADTLLLSLTQVENSIAVEHE